MVKDLSLTKNRSRMDDFQMVLSDPSTRPNSPTLTMMNPNMPMPLSLFAFEKKRADIFKHCFGRKGKKVRQQRLNLFRVDVHDARGHEGHKRPERYQGSSRAYARAEARVMHALRNTRKKQSPKNKEFYTRINKPALPLLERSSACFGLKRKSWRKLRVKIKCSLF